MLLLHSVGKKRLLKFLFCDFAFEQHVGVARAGFVTDKTVSGDKVYAENSRIHLVIESPMISHAQVYTFVQPAESRTVTWIVYGEVTRTPRHPPPRRTFY